MPQIKFDNNLFMSLGLPGTDGREMKKEYGNYISLSDTCEEISSKIKTMFTDPSRIRISDVGHPGLCPAWKWHAKFTGEVRLALIYSQCRNSSLTCKSCKVLLEEEVLSGLNWAKSIMETEMRLK